MCDASNFDIGAALPQSHNGTNKLNLISAKPIIFLFTQNSNPNHRVYRFQLTLKKFPNLHIVRTAGKNLALPDTLSRSTPPELQTRNINS